MLIKNYEKFLRLSKVLNSSFGASGAPTQATQSVKFDLLDDNMIKCRYIMVVNFNTDTMMREMMRRYQSEARNMLEAAIRKIVEDHKKLFPGEEVPELEILDHTIGEDVEFLTFSQYRGTRKAYYRFGCLMQVK